MALGTLISVLHQELAIELFHELYTASNILTANNIIGHRENNHLIAFAIFADFSFPTKALYSIASFALRTNAYSISLRL